MDNQSAAENGSSVFNRDEMKKAETIAASIGIPAQPSIVFEIQKEVGSSNVNLGRISDLVTRDVSLSAKVLKVANSPLFSRGATYSVLHALSLLGVQNFYIAVLQAALHESLEPYNIPLDAFWKHSQTVAATAVHIARDLKLENSE